jgi:anti-sigma regulatory factor (Ser/Thr protein kinase)
MMKSEPRVHVEVESRFENVELVQIAVESSLAQLDLSDDDAHQIGISIREAVANAIKHGNQGDVSKLVKVEIGIDDCDLLIRVHDQGVGFDVNGVPNPLEPENLLRRNGRGILLMNQFMDQIEYTFQPERGTVVEMRKRLAVLRSNSAKQQEEEKQ